VEFNTSVQLLLSKLTDQNQDQYDNDYEAKTAATVVAGSVEAASADAAEPSEQRDDEKDEQYGSYRHDIISLLRDRGRRIGASRCDNRLILTYQNRSTVSGRRGPDSVALGLALLLCFVLPFLFLILGFQHSVALAYGGVVENDIAV
jgi:hypothetical protein